MEIQLIGDQLILAGAVVGDEYARVANLLAGNPAVRRVILRNSKGGDAKTGYRIGELLRQNAINTAVSGYCFSACSRMFLGGKERNFTDDFPVEFTDIGFHGHYKAGRLRADLVERSGLKAWIVQYSDGKADERLVERWISIPLAGGMIHFFHPDIGTTYGSASFLCQGDETSHNGVFGCEPIGKTAVDLGIVTSVARVRSNDRWAR